MVSSAKRCQGTEIITNYSLIVVSIVPRVLQPGLYTLHLERQAVDSVSAASVAAAMEAAAAAANDSSCRRIDGRVAVSQGR